MPASLSSACIRMETAEGSTTAGMKTASIRAEACSGRNRASPGSRVRTEYVSASECAVRQGLNLITRLRSDLCSGCDFSSIGTAILVSKARFAPGSLASGIKQSENHVIGDDRVRFGYRQAIIRSSQPGSTATWNKLETLAVPADINNRPRLKAQGIPERLRNDYPAHRVNRRTHGIIIPEDSQSSRRGACGHRDLQHHIRVASSIASISAP